MPSTSRITPGAVLLAVLLAFLPGSAVAAGPAGLTVTINAPDTYSGQTAFTVSGYLVAYAQAPIYFEYSRGLANQTIEILVDDAPAAIVATNAEGFYQAQITLPATPPTTHVLRAVAYRDAALETSSPSRTITIDRILTSLSITPAGASVDPGDTVALRAIGEYSEGREADLTEFASWSSSDTSVATVGTVSGSHGIVTGIAPGTTQISASVEGSTATATIAVT